MPSDAGFNRAHAHARKVIGKSISRTKEALETAARRALSGNKSGAKLAARNVAMHLAKELAKTAASTARTVQRSAVLDTGRRYDALAAENGREPAWLDVDVVTEQSVMSYADEIDQQAAEFQANAFADAIDRLDEAELGEDEDLEAAAAALATEIADNMDWRAALVLAVTMVEARTAAQTDALTYLSQEDRGLGRQWNALDEMCPDCEDLDAEIVGVNESFSGGVDGPPLHPNCRCSVDPAYTEEADNAESPLLS